MNVSEHRVERFARDRVVFAGSQLGSQTLVQDGLSGNLGKDGNAQSHPGQLEAVSQEIEVSSHEDDRDDTGVGDSRGTYRQKKGRLATSTDNDHNHYRCGHGDVRGLFHDSSSEKKEW